MQRLSSRSTFVYKRIFPVFWICFMAIWVCMTWGVWNPPNGVPAPVVFVPFALAVLLGWLAFKRLILDLVDEVWLDDDGLLVKNRGEQVKVALDNVMNVSASTMTNPPRISLMLRVESSRLGKTVAFMPAGPGGFLALFKPHPIATMLIERVDAARRRTA